MNPSAVAQRLWPGRHAVVTPLLGGMTNHNFKIEVDGHAYVIRMGGAQAELLGIDRRVEREASRRAAEVGVGPAVERLVEPEGWLVTRFIEGKPIPVEAMNHPENIRRVAGALRRYHQAPPIPGRFDAHEVVETYCRKASARGVDIPDAYDRAHEMSERIRAARGPQPPVPCHNDLLNANFLDDGEIRIVDWEYAGMGDRFFDLANFSTNHEFGIDDDRALVAAYFGEPREDSVRDMQRMKFMSDFREAMWGVLQSGISELDFDFKEYAAKHFERMFERTATA